MLTAEGLTEIEDRFARSGVHGERTSYALREQIDDGAWLGTSSAGGHDLSPAKR